MAKMVFKNYGGSFQLRIETPEDLAHIQNLPESLWAATSIPINTLNCDRKFLEYVDTDKNGRIRTDELKQAQQWLFSVLSDFSDVCKGLDFIELEKINSRNPCGKALLLSAKRVLSNLNIESTRVNLSQVRDLQRIIDSSFNNGDGVISPEGLEDEELREFIQDVMSFSGDRKDISGKPGIGIEELDKFTRDLQEYSSWLEKAESKKNSREFVPFGKDTEDLFKQYFEVKTKIEEYFSQVFLNDFLGRGENLSRDLQKNISSPEEEKLQSYPLSLEYSLKGLNLTTKLNPVFREKVYLFKTNVLPRIFGKNLDWLSWEEWQKVKEVFSQYETWFAFKPKSGIEALGIDKIKRYLSQNYAQKAEELIKKDLSAAKDIEQISNLEKLLLYNKYLAALANNFVNFSYFYDPSKVSFLEAGKLIIDNRQMSFSILVEDVPAHKKIAQKSYMYLLYLKVTGRQEGKDKQFYAVTAVTSGGSGNLRIGKRGVFFTPDGKEWDAEVIDTAVNPIGIIEAVKSPFVQIGSFIKNQVDKITVSSQKSAEQRLTSANFSSIARDFLVGGSVALAALGSSFAYITQALAKVKFIHIISVVLGIIVFLLLPGVIIGFLRVRKRNLAVLLEASGWAVNLNMKINASLGRVFTRDMPFPKGAKKMRQDMLAKWALGVKRNTERGRFIFLVVLLLLLIIMLFIDIKSLGWKI